MFSKWKKYVYFLCCSVSFIFGIITCLAGFSGVALGMLAAKKLRPLSPRADPLVCAFGLITGAPFLLLCLALSRYQTIITWVSCHSLLYLFLYLFSIIHHVILLSSSLFYSLMLNKD